MRNPYIIEIKTEDKGIFATADNSKLGVSIKSVDELGETQEEINKQINDISEVPMNLSNYYQICSNQAAKMAHLLAFIDREIPSSRIIIFFATCASVNFHYLALQLMVKKTCQATAGIYKLHGKIDQKKRSKIYKQFKERKMDADETQKNHLILLTTDLSSRGIDIPDVDWIV